MKILSVHLKNYKSINDSGGLALNKKANVFAGKNNTGKTALIEGLYKVANSQLVEEFSDKGEIETTLELEIFIDEEELRFINNVMEYQYRLFEIHKLKLTISYNSSRNVSCINQVEGFRDNNYWLIYKNDMNPNTSHGFDSLNGNHTNFHGMPKAIQAIFSLLNRSVVFIDGSRHVPKDKEAQLSNKLTIDGNNLNEFLYTLHLNDEIMFDQITSIFKQIFNDVTSIGTPINGNGSTYISLKFEGNEKSIPLYNCGSGFTHVLLLLCVLFNQKNSIVLLDEPHVFLHPSAEKAIYDIIDETNDHQYLLTTHSPILINYSFEKNIFLVDKEKGVSRFTELDDIQEALTNIGVSNSDFALSDKILFVEGETEEAVIPQILSHFGMKQIGYNYRVLKMGGTGNEFTKKSVMTRNHEKLQLILGGISKSPIPYKIIIDLDEKNEQKVNELKEKYGESIIILERREFENYLIESYEELAEVINNNVGSEVTSHADVEKLIGEFLAQTESTKLFPKAKDNPLKNVVGSEVLEQLFDEYGVRFNKVQHGLEITALVLQKHPEKLTFFKDQLEEFINENEVKVKATVV
ncbi:AAA family ATPase [Priestia megaterium]|uniref:ATP-dependent nuclease n=1 Tax=Priestia megaterium TaxID=1404 RepID=UPI001EDB88D4|nr:AAA family ATPase [Priestia megaterium]UKJ81198.1 AAA family ATPase [Priestia megaterium]